MASYPVLAEAVALAAALAVAVAYFGDHQYNKAKVAAIDDSRKKYSATPAVTSHDSVQPRFAQWARIGRYEQEIGVDRITTQHRESLQEDRMRSPALNAAYGSREKVTSLDQREGFRNHARVLPRNTLAHQVMNSAAHTSLRRQPPSLSK